MDAQRTDCRKITFSIVGILLLAAMSGCATVKLPDITSDDFHVLEDEQRLFNRSKEAIEHIENSGKLYDDLRLNEYLTQLAESLIDDQEFGQEIKIKVQVVSDADLNAFAFPTGDIMLYVGIFPIIENEDQLATLLAHELTHVIKRHQVKFSRSRENRMKFFEITFGGIFPTIGTLGALSSISGLSKDHENEADSNAYVIIKKKGYDLKQTYTFFENMNGVIVEEKIKQPYFFASHPQNNQRISNFKDLIKEDITSKNEFYKDASDFIRRTDKVFYDGIQMWMSMGYFNSAEDFLIRNIGHRRDADTYFLLGEANRQKQDLLLSSKKSDQSQGYLKAIEYYDQALSLDAEQAESYKGKGLVLRKMGKMEESKELFKRYLSLKPAAADRSYIESYINLN